MSVPSAYQRCPGNARGAPVHSSSRADRPHLRLVSLPALKQHAHGDKARSLSMRQKSNSLSFSGSRQQCVTDQHHHEHRMDSPAPGYDREHCHKPVRHHHPHPWARINKIHPPGFWFELSLSRVPFHPVTLVENASILVEGTLTSDLPATHRSFFFIFISLFCLPVSRRPLLPRHGWNPPAANGGQHPPAADHGTSCRPTGSDRAGARRAAHGSRTTHSATRSSVQDNAIIAQDDSGWRCWGFSPNVREHSDPGGLGERRLDAVVGTPPHRRGSASLLRHAVRTRRQVRWAEEHSSVCAAQYFHDWDYKSRLPARAQAAELSRLARHWLLDGEPTAAQVAERVVIDRFLRALPRSHRQAVGMRNPNTVAELVEAVELADAAQHRDAGGRAWPFPRRVVQERRVPEGTSRPVARPAAPVQKDEPMPTADPTSPAQTWLAGCIVHQDLPAGAPEAEVKINGHPFPALLDSGSAVSLIQSRILAEKLRPPFRSLACMETRDTSQPGEWPFQLPLARGRWKWAWWRTCRSPSSLEEIGRGLITCLLPPYNLPAQKGAAAGKGWRKEAVVTPPCWPRTAGEMVSPLHLILTSTMTYFSRWPEAGHSPRSSARTTG